MAWTELYWKIFYRAVRVVAALFMVGSAAGAIVIATNRHSPMDPGLKWGIVVPMLVLCGLSALMLRAPPDRP